MVFYYCLNNSMRAIKNFSEQALKQIRIWTWAAAVLPITALAGMFFVWMFGTDTLFATVLSVGATIMFCVAAVWWWWIIWIVSKILKKDRQVAKELLNTTQEIRTIKILFRETFNKTDK